MTKLVSPEEFQRRTSSDAEARNLEAEYRRLEDVVFRAKGVLARTPPTPIGDVLDVPEVREVVARIRQREQVAIEADAAARIRAQHDIDTCEAVMRRMEDTPEPAR